MHRFGAWESEELPPPVPPELLEQYGHSPCQQPPELRSVAVSSTAGESGGWQGPEAGRASSSSIHTSLRQKYSRLPSSSSAGSRPGAVGSAGARAGGFAAAAAAAVAAAGLSRSTSLQAGLAGGGEQPQAGLQLDTIAEGSSGRASSGSGAASERPGQSADGSGSAAAAQPPSGTPSKYQKQLSAGAAANTAAVPGTPAAAAVARSPSLLQRLSSWLPGAGATGQAQGPSPTMSRSRSLLRVLSGRQLSRVSPQQDEPAAAASGTPPSPRALQAAAAAAAERLQRRPPSLEPVGGVQQEHARLLGAAREHLRRMQCAADEATMHAERRQVRACLDGTRAVCTVPARPPVVPTWLPWLHPPALQSQSTSATHPPATPCPPQLLECLAASSAAMQRQYEDAEGELRELSRGEEWRVGVPRWGVQCVGLVGASTAGSWTHPHSN